MRVRKTRPVAGFDIACKWKRNYQGSQVKDAWFILTDLGSLPVAIAAYKQRMGIEEMFRDCKTGGYNIEGTGLREERLIKMILLMAIAYTSAIFQGAEIQKKLQNMYLAVKKQAKNTADGVHLVWVRMESSGQIILSSIHRTYASTLYIACISKTNTTNRNPSGSKIQSI